MATPNKLNPFHISNQDDFDDGWDDWDDEGDAEEQQGLVFNGYDRSSAPAVHPANQLPRNPQYRPQGSFTVPKYMKTIFGGSIVFLLAFIVLSGGYLDDNEYHSLFDQAPNDEISHLVILGERHSGISWLESHLQKCYPNKNVSSSLQRMGYFFQDDPSSQKNNSIVVQIVLNPYDWLEQMRNNPMYMPNHALPNHIVKDGVQSAPRPLPWREFLEKEWSIERPEVDLEFKDSTGKVCQMEFRYDQVVSCVEIPGNENPIYELDKDGTPFSSILELRAAKLKNHRSIKDWETVDHLETVHYEDLHAGFKDLLKKIEKVTGWIRSCSTNVLPPALSHTETMSLEFVDYVTKHAYWQLEEDIAKYQKWDAKDVARFSIKSETGESDEADADEEDSDANDDESDGDEEDDGDAEEDPDDNDPICSALKKKPCKQNNTCEWRNRTCTKAADGDVDVDEEDDDNASDGAEEDVDADEDESDGDADEEDGDANDESDGDESDGDESDGDIDADEPAADEEDSDANDYESDGDEEDVDANEDESDGDADEEDGDANDESDGDESDGDIDADEPDADEEDSDANDYESDGDEEDDGDVEEDPDDDDTICSALEKKSCRHNDTCEWKNSTCTKAADGDVDVDEKDDDDDGDDDDESDGAEEDGDTKAAKAGDADVDVDVDEEDVDAEEDPDDNDTICSALEKKPCKHNDTCEWRNRTCTKAADGDVDVDEVGDDDDGDDTLIVRMLL
jgi:hypothetical protein